MNDPLFWVRIRSWHIVALGGRTLCGRTYAGGVTTTADLPLSQKSCETCARLSLHAVETRS